MSKKKDHACFSFVIELGLHEEFSFKVSTSKQRFKEILNIHATCITKNLFLISGFRVLQFSIGPLRNIFFDLSRLHKTGILRKYFLQQVLCKVYKF